MSNKYILKVKNGGIIFWTPFVIPLVLWGFLLYNFFDFSSIFQGLKKQLSFNQLGLLCSAFVPFLYVFSTLYNCLNILELISLENSSELLHNRISLYTGFVVYQLIFWSILENS